MNAVVRNIARRFETRWARKRKKDAGGATVLEKQEANEQHLSSAFDRAWMMAFLDQTMVLLKDRARDQGEDTLRRVELLRLRFNEDLPIRAIAQQWNRPADAIHYEYRKARKEFVTALRDVIAFHHPGDPLALEREIARFRDHINR